MLGLKDFGIKFVLYHKKLLMSGMIDLTSEHPFPKTPIAK